MVKAFQDLLVKRGLHVIPNERLTSKHAPNVKIELGYMHFITEWWRAVEVQGITEHFFRYASARWHFKHIVHTRYQVLPVIPGLLLKDGPPAQGDLEGFRGQGP